MGEIRTWGGRSYMKTPRGWILTDESVNRIVETEFRERNAQVETRMKNDPEFKLIYQKDHGEGNTSFTSPEITPPWIAAPIATASSGFTEWLGSFPNALRTAS